MVEVEQAKIVGLPLAGASMFAGLSVWMAAGIWHESYERFHRPVGKMNHAANSADLTAPVVTSLVCVGLHLLMISLRWLITRREKTVGFRGGFWRVLMIASYWVGFAGGSLLFYFA